MSAYPETLSDLFARAAGEFKLGLDGPRALLGALGNPERQLRRVVLVAGTNGKGMTAALIATTLQASGYRVGFFPSPHLLSFRERIQIDGRPISEDEVVAAFAQIRAVEQRCPARPSFFECTTAMAAMAFARAQLDVAVFEVGLGGRLDATNVIPRDLAVLTPIGLDHQQILGATVPLIAAEKADIIAPGRPVVVAAQAPEAMAVIERFAAERRAPLWCAPTPRLAGDMLRLDGLAPPFAAFSVPADHPPYFRLNWACAARALERLASSDLPCPAAAWQRAVTGLHWPGRYQWLAGEPPHLLDGAHNEPAMTVLIAALGADARLRGRPLHCVFSALKDKAAPPMLALLEPAVSTLHLCPLPGRRGRDPTELAALSPGAQLHPQVGDALTAAARNAHADGGVVLVTGSLKLVGLALAALTGAAHDPPVDG